MAALNLPKSAAADIARDMGIPDMTSLPKNTQAIQFAGVVAGWGPRPIPTPVF